MTFPWITFIQKRKDQIMIDMKGKIVIGLTANEWVEFDKKFQEKYPIVYKLDSICTDIEHRWNRLVDRIRSPKYYLSNILYGTHYLKTTLKKGKWYEPNDRLEDALFLLMRNFIEYDDKVSYDYYIVRKNNGFKDNDDRNDLYELCTEASNFWFKEKIDLENKIQELYATIPEYKNEHAMVMLSRGLDPERDKIRDKVFKETSKIEDEIITKTTYYLTKLIFLRGSLWS